MTRAGTARQTQQQQPPPSVVGPASGVFGSSSENDFFDLQREAGNQVVADWLKARVNNSAFQEIGASAMMSRATAGTFIGKVVFVLPGSENAVRLAMTRLIIPELAHVVQQVRK